MCHIEVILTGVWCGDNICAPDWMIMIFLVMLCEVVFHVVFLWYQIKYKLPLSDSIPDPIESHKKSQDMHWQMLFLKNKSSVAMSVFDGLGDCLWPIYVRAKVMSPTFWKFTNMDPNYDYIAMNRMLHIVVHYTLIVPLSGGESIREFLVSYDWALM